jgi:hypothetical protein
MEATPHRASYPCDLQKGVIFGRRKGGDIACRLTVETYRPENDRLPVPRLRCKPDAVANGRVDRRRDHWQLGQNRLDAVGQGLENVLQRLPGGAPVGFLDEHCDRARPVNADEEVELPSAVCASANPFSWFAGQSTAG